MKLKNILASVIAIATALSVAGCSENGLDIGGGNGVDIPIEKIEWSMEQGVVDGKRHLLLSYTNNTGYTITSFDLSFKEKEGLEAEKINSFYSDIQKSLELDDDEVAQLRDKAVSMHTESNHVVAPGSSASESYCYYFSGYYYVRDISHYELVEPDIAEIEYIKDDRIYTCYYDFGAKNYTTDEETIPAVYWPETTLGSVLPKPSAPVIKEESINNEESFYFRAYGLTLADFDSYITECKNKGFTVDSKSYEGFYSADNAEGYNVYLSYDETNDCINGSIKAPR